MLAQLFEHKGKLLNTKSVKLNYFLVEISYWLEHNMKLQHYLNYY